MKVTVWNENVHEKTDEAVKAVYPNGIHGAIASFLQEAGFDVKIATLDQPSHGLTDEVLDNTDVLLWWGHMAHGEVDDEIVNKVHEKVLHGMGLILLHSAHFSNETYPTYENENVRKIIINAINWAKNPKRAYPYYGNQKPLEKLDS